MATKEKRILDVCCGWKEMISQGFKECFRVLKPNGVLVFKWSEIQVPLKDVLPLAPFKPILGSRGGRSYNAIWLVYMKPKECSS